MRFVGCVNNGPILGFLATRCGRRLEIRRFDRAFDGQQSVEPVEQNGPKHRDHRRRKDAPYCEVNAPNPARKPRQRDQVGGVLDEAKRSMLGRSDRLGKSERLVPGAESSPECP